MGNKLNEVKVAVLIANGFEQFEFSAPGESLKQEGAKVLIVSPRKNVIPIDQEEETGVILKADSTLENIKPENFDALLIPGGVDSIETLRMDLNAIAFIRHFLENRKPVAALSHGVYLLLEADGVRGRKLTSNNFLKTDFQKAGAHWTNEDIVRDGNLLTCKGVNYFTGFIEELISMLIEDQDLKLHLVNKEETEDIRFKSHPTDAMGENSGKKWGVSDLS